MINGKNVLIFFSIVIFCILLFFISSIAKNIRESHTTQGNALTNPIHSNQFTDTPLSVVGMRQKSYPGSDLVIEETLVPGSDYTRYIASYQSEGLKMYGLLTIPTSPKPQQGYPVIIFNHGYIPPDSYVTTERYVAYVDTFARHGYIVFKPDYRGHGQSEGKPEGAYYSPAYAIDVLNALASLKKYKDANPNKIGMWGHSMGGNITLRDLVVNRTDIKAAVIWGGVVGSYNDLMNNWQRNVRYRPPPTELSQRNNYRKTLIDSYGTPQTNPDFWNAMDPTMFLSDITAPIQLHTGGDDEEVPVAFSQNLFTKLQQLQKTVEYYNYPGGDHNIDAPNFNLAMERSLAFFDRYLK